MRTPPCVWSRTVLCSPALWLTVGPLAAMALLAWHLGVPAGTGVDTAAHAYKIAVARLGGGWLWDGFWYSGSYAAASYGYFYYLVAAYSGQTMLVVAATGLLPILYWCYLRGMWGLSARAAIPAAIALGVTVGLAMPFGEYPFLVGLTLMMSAAALLATGKRAAAAAAALPVAAALFANPLAVLCVSVFFVADFVGRPKTRRQYAIFAAALTPFAVIRLAMLLAFSQPSVEIDLLASQIKFVAIGVAGAILMRLSSDPQRRVKALVFLVAAVACGLAWLVPHNPVGDDMGRFFMIFAIPVLLAVRPLRLSFKITGVVACALLVLPLSMIPAAIESPGPTFATWRAFFAPALQLASRYDNPNYRFEVVPLAKHWDAYFFPLAGYPLAQGWYRQSDALHNAVLRSDGLTATQYATWLRDVGVEYVFLPHADLAPSSRRIPDLLDGSRQFVRVATHDRWTVYRLRAAQPLVVSLSRSATPAVANVRRYTRDALAVAIARPGDYLVKVSWTPFWRLACGAGTLSPAPGGWVSLHAARAGLYELRFQVTIARVLNQIF